MPIFAWAMLVFAVMIVIAFPSIILGTLLLEFERAFNWPFFDPTRGGDPMLWQHLFWFFGHPEVYIIFIPAAGMMSMMVATVAQTPLVGYRLVVLAMVATGFISFGVWAHHMFAVGMPEMSTGFFSAASMAVSLPAGIQVFAWIATLAAGKVRWSTPALFVVGVDPDLHHRRADRGDGRDGAVRLAGARQLFHRRPPPLRADGRDGVPACSRAFYYWIPMISRNALSERVGKWVFWLMFGGHAHLAFFPMHLSGLMGMPRRVYTYLPSGPLELMNLISTVGAFVLASGVLLFLVDVARNFRWAPAEGNAGNVFGAGSLEWLPSGLYSTRSIPVVHQPRIRCGTSPSWRRRSRRAATSCPTAPTGLRETIVTSPIEAEPQYVEIMPGPSPWPFAVGDVHRLLLPRADGAGL